MSSGSAIKFWTLNGTHIFNNNAGNVGIGLNTPLAPLHIKNDNEALRIQGATPYLSFSDNVGQVKGFLQSYNNDLYLGTPSSNTTGNLQFYAVNIPALTIKPTADVVIGGDVAVEHAAAQHFDIIGERRPQQRLAPFLRQPFGHAEHAGERQGEIEDRRQELFRRLVNLT